MELVWKQPFDLNIYEVGPRAEARLDAVMNFLQQSASLQSDSWKVGVADLVAKGRTWVLSRHHLCLTRYPRLGERVEVRTWSSGFNGIFATREFEVACVDQVLASATTSWVILDLQLKRPTQASETMSDEHTIARRAVEDSFSPLPALDQPDREVGLRVMHRDLDINGHVNHTVYVQWAHEALPLELARSWRAVELEVDYRAEALYGDEILSRLQTLERSETEARFVHQIVNARTGAELTRMRTVWRPGRRDRKAEGMPVPTAMPAA